MDTDTGGGGGCDCVCATGVASAAADATVRSSLFVSYFATNTRSGGGQTGLACFMQREEGGVRTDQD